MRKDFPFFLNPSQRVASSPYGGTFCSLAPGEILPEPSGEEEEEPSGIRPNDRDEPNGAVVENEEEENEEEAAVEDRMVNGQRARDRDDDGYLARGLMDSREAPSYASYSALILYLDDHSANSRERARAREREFSSTCHRLLCNRCIAHNSYQKEIHVFAGVFFGAYMCIYIYTVCV